MEPKEGEPPSQQADAPKVIKLIPRNLTARAEYLVEGNPATSRPESGVDISFPGLELDQRNLDQRFFPGLYFEYQRQDGAILAGLDLKQNQLVSGLSKADLAPDRPLFLLGLYGRFRVEDRSPRFFSFHRKSGAEAWRRVHDLLPGRVAVIFGPSWEVALGGDALKAPDARLKELDAAYHAEKDEERFRVNRGGDGLLAYAVFSDERARYLDDYGVIDVETFPPGELTKTLCAPWIYDFRDCVCFYWASNKPDLADAGGVPNLNFLRDRRQPEPPKPTRKYFDWLDQRMSQARLAGGGWKELPVVLDDAEVPERPARLKAFAAAHGTLGLTLSLEDIVNEFQYLATVEHALVVEYLFAHYSLNAPAERPAAGGDAEALIIFDAASDLLAVAIDEMRHFLWVNQVLRLLGCNVAVTGRAKRIGLPPEKDKEHKRRPIPDFKYLNLPFRLRELSPEVLDEFIDIEANSKTAGPGGKSFGMYVHLLAGLLRQRSEIPNADHVIRLVKLLIDEGDDHGSKFKSIADRLSGVKGARTRETRRGPARDADPEQQQLLKLGDEYYQELLELIHVSYEKGVKAGGKLIADAVTLMRELHDIGHALAKKNIGLRFTLPKPQRIRRTLETKGAAGALRQWEQRISSRLAEVAKTDDPETRQMAERHLHASKAIHRKMLQTVGESE